MSYFGPKQTLRQFLHFYRMLEDGANASSSLNCFSIDNAEIHMKNSFKLKRQLTCEIALKTLPVLTFAFCVGVPVAIAEPLIKGTESTATPSDNSSIITTPTDPNATDSNSRRLTPHKYYKGANPSSENNSEESKNTGTTYRNEATGSGTRFRNGTKGIGTGTSGTSTSGSGSLGR